VKNPAIRVAVIHEWLTSYVGSEKVLEQILNLYPEADLFVVVDFLPPDQRAFLSGRTPKTTFIQRLPGARRRFRSYLPLMPLAIEQFALKGYDLVISSSHAVAKGAITGPDQLHICYCHSPIRYAWDLQSQYLKESGLESGVRSWLVRLMLHYLRIWDCRTAHGVDEFIANSHFIAKRVRKVYGRGARVIHPPVDTSFFTPAARKEDYYLAASRFVAYKRMDIVVEAFRSLPDRRLIVIGDGPEFAKCARMAPANVTLLGHQSGDILRHHMQSARAFLFAAEEDFGIAPVEAQACGTPVICYGRGGVLDSVIDGVTGVYFPDQSAESLASAVRKFESLAFSAITIRNNAERFAPGVFRQAFREFTDAALAARSSATGRYHLTAVG
jgi:glycosyltransferase involved in cell wall biosynthesis